METFLSPFLRFFGAETAGNPLSNNFPYLSY